MSDHEIARIRRVYAAWEDRLIGTLAVDSSNPGNVYLWEELRNELLKALRNGLRKPLVECRVLDIGCGFGVMLGWLHEAGVPAANIFGIDLLPRAIAIAQQQFPQFTLKVSNAEQLDFPKASFDLVVLSTVFSSVLDPGMATNLARGASRVLTKDGAIFWYDMRYRNPWNREVRAITKSEIRSLFPGYTLDLSSITLVPQLARRLGRITRFAYPLMSSLPFCRTHYVGLLRPPREHVSQMSAAYPRTPRGS